MKCLFSIEPYPSLCSSYSFNHIFGILSRCFNEVFWLFRGQTINEFMQGNINVDYYIIIDNIGENGRFVDVVTRMKKNGTKIVVVTYDPPNFKDIDVFDSKELLNAVITFDKKFDKRFKCTQFIFDYMFDPKFIPTTVKTEYSNSVCIYGTIDGEGRGNRYNLTKIDDLGTDYNTLYNRIQDYNGCHVFTPGLSEDGRTLIHYNKAKPIEILLCGRNPYCEEGLDYLSYNKYLKTADMIPNPVPVDFDRNEILSINESNVSLLKECIIHGI